MAAGHPYSWLLMFSMLLLIASSNVVEGRLECEPKCKYRCSATSHRKPCMFFCLKCCAKCLCVPPGTYGHKETCPCYNNWKTKEGGPKCPGWRSCVRVLVVFFVTILGWVPPAICGSHWLPPPLLFSSYQSFPSHYLLISFLLHCSPLPLPLGPAPLCSAYGIESLAGLPPFLMALMAGKIPSSPIATHRATISPSHRTADSAAKWAYLGSRRLLLRKFHSLNDRFSCLFAKSWGLSGPRKSTVLCWSNRAQDTETKERSRSSRQEDLSCTHIGGGSNDQLNSHESSGSSQGLAEACRFIYNDAKFVNERARNDIVLLSRGIMRLDARARQDVAMIGLEFLKLDARAREDTEKIDRNVKKKAEHLHQIASILKNKAQTKLKTAADKHWSDGALEADLRLVDFRAKQRAMEDALMALEFVKDIHDMMVRKMYRFPLLPEEDSASASDMMRHITLEKNGRALEFFPGEVSTDRITAIQEAYWSMASALSEADGIDYTDPEELELLITTLIDLNALDGKSSVSLLAECSSSPDVNTRKALANALATAPSMWTLGNAGMGALQRLAEDSNPAISAAASKAINALKKQWEIEEGDSWRFMVDQDIMSKTDRDGNGDNTDYTD